MSALALRDHTVDNQGQVDQAVQIARAADGVSGMKNELRLKP